MRATPTGVVKCGRTRDHRHVGTRFGGGLRDREAHLAGARVRDAAHRIDRFERRARGDQHTLADEMLRLAQRSDRGEKSLRLPAFARHRTRCTRARRCPARGSTRRPPQAARRCAASPGSATSARSSPGATSSGHSRARQSVDRRSSATPCASLARKFADAGATTMACAPRDDADMPHRVVGARAPQVGQHAVARTAPGKSSA